VPISHYVEDILQNGRSIYDTGLEVGTNEPDPVQIVLKSGAGTVEGAVVDAADKPVAGATVALVPLNRRENASLYRNIVTGQTGNYSLRGITPGEYKLFAWPAQVNGAFYNAEFLAKYEESGLPITVGANSKATVKIPLSGQRP
jgi:protocatechuate 3,4-dioxygenase beta subunit